MGAECELKQCPNDCNGRGLCFNGKCVPTIFSFDLELFSIYGFFRQKSNKNLCFDSQICLNGPRNGSVIFDDGFLGV